MVLRVDGLLNCVVCWVRSVGIVVRLVFECMLRLLRVRSALVKAVARGRCMGSFPINAMHVSWHLLMVDSGVVVEL